MNAEKLLEIRRQLELAIQQLESQPAAGVQVEKIDLKQIICFAIPIWNMVAPMFQLPPLPVPAFCNV